MNERLLVDAALVGEPVGTAQCNATLSALQYRILAALSCLAQPAPPNQLRRVRTTVMKAIASAQHIPALRRSPAVRVHMQSLGLHPDQQFNVVGDQVDRILLLWDELYGVPLYQPTGVRNTPANDDGVRNTAARGESS